MNDFAADNVVAIHRSSGAGGGGGDGGSIQRMEARIAKIEAGIEKSTERLDRIELDLAVMKANYATREDLHKAINEQTWKLITWTTGLGGALVAITFWIARTVH